MFVLPALLAVAGIVGWWVGAPFGVDSAVYRSGALALLNGQPLYDMMSLPAEPSWARLPFTYPPTATLLFVPLALFPAQVSWGLLGALSASSVAVVVHVCVRRLSSPPGWLTTAGATAVLSVLVFVLEPVWRTVALGQINLVLLALVVLDVLVLGTRPKWRVGGVLIGVAAAVKLTPLVFVPHLWLAGRRADAVRALIVFAASQALLWLVVPHDVTRFWGSAVTDPGRTGPVYWAGNQSLNGLLLRLTGLASWSLAASVGLAALLAVPAVWLVRRLLRADRPVEALLVTAFFGLVVSPVSWSHHWVWAVPLVVCLLGRLPRAPRPANLALVASVVVVFASCVLILMRNHHQIAGAELRWQPAEFVIGSAYLLVPLLAGTIVLVRVLRGRPRAAA